MLGILDATQPAAFHVTSTLFGPLDFQPHSQVIMYLFIGLPTLWLVLRAFGDTRRRSLPPGPRGIPILGNVFQLTGDVFLTFHKWKRKFGPLVYLRAGGQDILLLNTHEVAFELLDRRAAIYSGRPKLIVASELMTGGLFMPLQSDNDAWRRMRRASHEHIGPSAVHQYRSTQMKEATIMVEGLLREANTWRDELERMSVSLAMGVVYRQPTISSLKDPRATHLSDFLHHFTLAASPGTHLVEYITWMKYLPASVAKWKRDALNRYHRDWLYFKNMYMTVEDRIRNGEHTASLAASLIRDREQLGLSEKEAVWTAAAIYGGGAETMMTSLSWFLVTMVSHPDIQKKAQNELDAVVGQGRMPNFSDREHLPYIDACLRETLRWKGVTPVGVVHQTAEDDWYEGYFIPKGTICIPNQRSMNRDPDVYGPDVNEFKPERHLDNNGRLVCPFPNTHDGHVSYGFGRRICVGRYIADDTLFIAMASLLWAATIAPVKDADGNLVMPDTEGYDNRGLVLAPLPFKCSVKPRFPGAEEIISHAREMFEE